MWALQQGKSCNLQHCQLALHLYRCALPLLQASAKAWHASLECKLCAISLEDLVAASYCAPCPPDPAESGMHSRQTHSTYRDEAAGFAAGTDLCLEILSVPCAGQKSLVPWHTLSGCVQGDKLPYPWHNQLIFSQLSGLTKLHHLGMLA